jgi:sigma-B regulation protein RsbU (phosphoserine phosphatase)
MAAVQEIAHVVSSTLDIDQVYEKFAAEVKKLVELDRIGISVIDHEAGTFSPRYVSGVRIAGRDLHAVVPLEGTLVERVLQEGTPLSREDIRSGDTYPGDPARIGAGLRSGVMVPLFCKGRIMGNLHVYSIRMGAYGTRELVILKRLADQIAPAVENAELYLQLQKRIEENAIVDEVARIVSSTLDIDRVYEKFAAEVKKLVDFDRIAISVIDHDAGTSIEIKL